MNNNSSSSSGNFTEETKNKLLFVAEKILSKAELSTSQSGVIWFEVNGHELGLAEHELIIKKVEDLGLIAILDKGYSDVGIGSAILHPITYQLSVYTPALRKFVNNLEEKNQKHTLDNNDIIWPDDYKWDKDMLNFQVQDGKKLPFSKNSSGIWKVFNSLVKRKGGWVRVSTLSEESGIKNEQTVRVVVNNIKTKIQNHKLGKYLKIESSKDDKSSLHGAYRVLPT